MGKYILSVLIGGVVGVGAGVAVGIFIYPYIFLADIVGSDTVTGRTEADVVATATFIHANPSDPIHYGRGGVAVYSDLLHLEPNFEVGPGPKFHVYLVPVDKVTPDTAVDETMYVDLGRLKAFKGSQTYPIPAGTDLKSYGNVVVWCEQFGVLISPAQLARKGGPS